MTESVLWTDSAYVATGLCAILDACAVVPHETNEDLWDVLTECVLAMPIGVFKVQHGASHKRLNEQPDDFHTWTALWNAWADRQARRVLLEDASELRVLQDHYEKAFLEGERTVDLFRHLPGEGC